MAAVTLAVGLGEVEADEFGSTAAVVSAQALRRKTNGAIKKINFFITTPSLFLLLFLTFRS